MLKIGGVLLFSLLCGGCGFQLNGGHQLFPSSFQEIYVNSSDAPHSTIAPSLEVTLKSNRITCVNNSAEAKYFLNIRSDTHLSHQVGAGASQETRKYALSITVVFDITDKSGKKIYGPITITASKIHYVYSGQVFGNNQEEETLYRSLNEDVIQKIIFALGSEQLNTALL